MTEIFPIENLHNLARHLGITRLADITGLDIVGLPVVQAVRPFSLSNAVSQGKGQTIAAATLSAVFESAESFAAEQLKNFDVTFASADDLGIPANRFENHLLNGNSSGWRQRTLPWIEARNLVNDEVAMLPLELVHTAYVLPRDTHDGVFCGSTTGLAAAFEAHDATQHGMLECIERDAIARAHKTHGFLQRRRIDPDTIRDQDVCNLIKALQQRGFLVGLWHAQSPTGVPVIWCHLIENCEPGLALMPFPAEGSAARLDAAAAITHAIYEAAQSRLTAISGARDDFTRRNYPKYPDWQMLRAHRKLLAECLKEIHFDDVQNEFSSGKDGLLSKLEATGHGDVYEVQLEHGVMPAGVAVRKIVIPSLLPLLEG